MNEITRQIRQIKWVEIIRECNSSGIPKNQWMAEHGINSKSFYRYQKMLREHFGRDYLYGKSQKDTRSAQSETGKNKDPESNRMTKAQAKQIEKEKECEEGCKLKSYSLCKFKNGKVYNCDLNASYNIGARYFIREILKSLPATVRLDIEAKVPECSKRSTCTLSTLINLNAGLMTVSS